MYEHVKSKTYMIMKLKKKNKKIKIQKIPNLKLDGVTK